MKACKTLKRRQNLIAESKGIDATDDSDFFLIAGDSGGGLLEEGLWPCVID